MKIIIAPDSFKGSVSSIEAANAINRGILQVDPLIETVQLPMADGGEGTVDAVLWNRGGEKIKLFAEDPIGRKVSAVYGWIEQEKTAVIETAAASGLPLLKKWELDPVKASSFGTGQLVGDALERGAETIILGLGGSATIDAGTGLFEALGARFYDSQGTELQRVGGQLHKVATMDISNLEPKLKEVKMIVASDVSNPLLGKEGAITVFGPQKGVLEREIAEFEKGMEKFSKVASATTGQNRVQEAGSGAAGGIGFLMKTILGAEFQNGLELMVKMSGLQRHLEGADLVLTGEGRIDGQSIFGKVPVGIGRAAKKRGVPVIAFAGSIGMGLECLEKEGIVAIMPIADGPMTLDRAMKDGEQLLVESSKRLMKIMQVGKMTGGDVKND